MSQSRAESGEIATWRSARPYVWALVICWLLPAAAARLGQLLLPDELPDGQCEGIGFGCTPTPADSVWLLWLMTAPFWVLAGCVVCGVIAAIRSARTRRERAGVTPGTRRRPVP